MVQIHSVGSYGGDDGAGRRVLESGAEGGPHGVEKHCLVGAGDDVPHVGVHVPVPAAPVGGA